MGRLGFRQSVERMLRHRSPQRPKAGDSRVNIVRYFFVTAVSEG
jgi:hypothetical protein